MRLSERDAQILQHIIRYAKEIEEAINFFGEDKSTFVKISIYHNAVSMALLQIGELVKNLSAGFMETHPDIPYRDIIGMRNRFAHGYSDMDFETIWLVAREDAPVLSRLCQQILAKQSNSESSADTHV